MSEWIDPRHAQLVADYKAAQEESDDNVWSDRPNAPYRIKSFIMAPVSNGTE
jgi:hypothetical protein